LDVDRPASWISRIPFFSRSPSLYKNTRHVAIVLKEVPTGFEDKDTSDSDLDDHDFDDHDDVGPSPKVELDAIGGEDALSEGEEEGEDENKEGDEDIGDEKEEEEEDIDKNEDEDESEWEDEDNEDFLSFALSRDEPVEIEESPTTVLPNDEPVEDFLCAAPKAEQPIEEQEQEDFLAISLPEEKAEAADECGNEEEFDFLADLLFEEEESEAVSKDSGTECAIPNDVPQAIVQTEPTIAKSSVDSHVPVASSMKAQIPQPHAPLVAKKRKAAQYCKLVCPIRVHVLIDPQLQLPRTSPQPIPHRSAQASQRKSKRGNVLTNPLLLRRSAKPRQNSGLLANKRRRWPRRRPSA